MSLEQALQEHEESVDGLLRTVNRYVSVLKSWKKACRSGHIGNLQKASQSARELVEALPERTAETATSWVFDLRDYLETDAWRQEIQKMAAERFSLRTLAEEDLLISSPITMRALPGRGVLALGKTAWPNIRPRVVAAELKRLRDKTVSANAQEFAESLYQACVYLAGKENPHGLFRAIYDLFCLTPGYKKENPQAAFAQQIYALHRAEIRSTRSGRKFEIEYATGNAKPRDVFTVIAEDGRPIRYFNIWFK